MRIIADIEEDVLQAAKELARQRGVSIGKALCDLARQALLLPSVGSVRNGGPLFPVQPSAQIVTPESVNQLRDEMA